MKLPAAYLSFLFFFIIFFVGFFFIFHPKVSALIYIPPSGGSTTYTPPGGGTATCNAGQCCDDGLSDCIDYPTNYCDVIGPPTAPYCNTGTWQLTYPSACRICKTGALGVCSFESIYAYYTCDVNDRCYGATIGGSGYDPAGRVSAGRCSVASFDGVNPNSACITGGVYKQCCSAGGVAPATACSGGTCPGGSITAPEVTTCGAPPPGAPSAGGSADATCSSGSVDVTFRISPGFGASQNYVAWAADSPSSIIPPSGTVYAPPPGGNLMSSTSQTFPGFSPGHTIYYEYWSCNSGGCTSDPNVYYYVTPYPATCSGPTSPPPATPTTNPSFCSGTCGAFNFSNPPGGPNVSCTTSSGQAGIWTYDGSPAQSKSNCDSVNAYCYFCNPTSGPPPTSPPGCHTQGQSCSPSCCTPLVCSGGTCQPPPPPPTAPPSCRNFNQSCGVGANCCSPLVCTGGACAVPTPTPVPHVTIQGHFVDSNGNDLTLNIGQGVTLRQNSTGSTFAPSGVSNSIFWSNFLTPGTYTVTANVPANYTVTSSTAINGTSHLPGSYVSTNPVTVTLPSNGNYADIFFRYALRTCTTTFSGNVVVDPTTNNCSSLAALGGSLYSGFGQVTAYNGTVPAASQVNVSAGSYAGLSYSPICGTPSTITISGTLYPVIGICDDGTYHAQTSYTYPYTNTNSPSVARNVTFLLTSQGPWYQVDSGDVRFPNLTNKVPRGQNASLNGTSLFASSTGNVTLGAGNFPLTTNWQVNQEYAYNSDFENGLGSMSYTFYMNRAKQRQLLPNNNNLSTTVNLDLGTLGSGVYQTDGDLSIKASTISSSCAAGGKHIVILVKGTATVNGNISVAAGQCNLFVLAAKTGLVFANTVGTNSLSSTTSNADGYYTSEGNITLNGGNVCPTPDLRLNVGGALIANSIHPFAKNASGGKIIVNRNLCGSNLTNPAYYVSPRPDFLLQMTDFYKISYKTVKEVEP